MRLLPRCPRDWRSVPVGCCHRCPGCAVRAEDVPMSQCAAILRVLADGQPHSVRLIARTEQRGDCWIWSGALNSGYGYCTINGENWLVHRFLYEQLRGPIGDGLHLHHVCQTRACVNPDHLEEVTQAEHTARHGGIPQALRDRANDRLLLTHCPHGHPYSGDNLRLKTTARGGINRICRTCSRDADRRRRARLKAAA